MLFCLGLCIFYGHGMKVELLYTLNETLFSKCTPNYIYYRMFWDILYKHLNHLVMCCGISLIYFKYYIKHILCIYMEAFSLLMDRKGIRYSLMYFIKWLNHSRQFCKMYIMALWYLWHAPLTSHPFYLVRLIHPIRIRVCRSWQHLSCSRFQEHITQTETSPKLKI